MARNIWKSRDSTWGNSGNNIFNATKNAAKVVAGSIVAGLAVGLGIKAFNSSRS